jgi:vacuole morphology and inheritance protein 14
LALRWLCTLLDSERVCRELAAILEGEADLEFATIMVQVKELPSVCMWVKLVAVNCGRG